MKNYLIIIFRFSEKRYRSYSFYVFCQLKSFILVICMVTRTSDIHFSFQHLSQTIFIGYQIFHKNLIERSSRSINWLDSIRLIQADSKKTYFTAFGIHLDLIFRYKQTKKIFMKNNLVYFALGFTFVWVEDQTSCSNY